MREYESPSSLTTFLKCPYAYFLRYIQKTEAVVPEKVQIGSWYHKQLEIIPNHHKDAQPLVDDLQGWLAKEKDEILQVEQSFLLEISEGQKIKIVIDALTKNKKIVDYKITGAPAFYGFTLSFQMVIYYWALRKLDLGYTPIYLLFEYTLDKDKKFKFKKLHEEVPFISDIELEIQKRYVLTTIDMLKVCWENMSFPPTYNSCFSCFYKEACPHYWGY